jgi:hypothetical protein
LQQSKRPQRSYETFFYADTTFLILENYYQKWLNILHRIKRLIFWQKQVNRRSQCGRVCSALSCAVLKVRGSNLGMAKNYRFFSLVIQTISFEHCYLSQYQKLNISLYHVEVE